MILREELEAKLSEKSLEQLDKLVACIHPRPPLQHGLTPRDTRRARKRVGEEIRQLELLERCIRARGARTRTDWNQLMPVNKLPAKVLLQIFLYGVSDDIERRDLWPSSSRTISHVCRLWRDLALASPCLWTLYNHMHPHVLSVRAGGTLRDVMIESNSPKGYLPLAFSNMRSLHIVLSGANPLDLSEYMHNNAPFLTTMSISNIAKRMTMKVVTVPKEPFGARHKIEEVHIRKCRIPWETSFMQGLLRLSIHDTQAPLAYLNQVLQACPGLLDLEVRNCKVVSTDKSPHPLLLVPSLRTLSIAHSELVGKGKETDLLDNILVPHDTRITIHYTPHRNIRAMLETPSWKGHPTLITNLTSPLRICLVGARVLTVNICATRIKENRGAHLNIVGDDFTITFVHCERKTLRHMDLLSGVVASAPHIQTLHINNTGDDLGIQYGPNLSKIITNIRGLLRMSITRLTPGVEDDTYEQLALRKWQGRVEEIILNQSRSRLRYFNELVRTRARINETLSEPLPRLRLVINSCPEVTADVVGMLRPWINVDWDAEP
ncbi:hypothetical protein BOTBODRAFT_63716 [Botryobasidium botryosum FD-172 SS1]|uniref:Uncharacterized protein n=1 Tax=Botryobasidium botryosum (strain FD-172 SS1) TaxID=930990 RepID=A0A067N2I9_BOTB1|nr:hypothetical protein BOTBODRAFT_63716 [Botryobasidium botryosum FD-172 SS1]